jgi:hypothetical protein
MALRQAKDRWQFMTTSRGRPTLTLILVWLIPAFASIGFTVFTLVVQKGVEFGLGAMLASILYFVIRYGAHTQDTPPQ